MPRVRAWQRRGQGPADSSTFTCFLRAFLTHCLTQSLARCLLGVVTRRARARMKKEEPLHPQTERNLRYLLPRPLPRALRSAGLAFRRERSVLNYLDRLFPVPAESALSTRLRPPNQPPFDLSRRLVPVSWKSTAVRKSPRFAASVRRDRVKRRRGRKGRGKKIDNGSSILAKIQLSTPLSIRVHTQVQDTSVHVVYRYKKRR